MKRSENKHNSESKLLLHANDEEEIQSLLSLSTGIPEEQIVESLTHPDLSKLIILTNPNKEISLGYKINYSGKIFNSLNTFNNTKTSFLNDKLLILNSYKYLSADSSMTNNRRIIWGNIGNISQERFYQVKVENLFIKYTIFILGLIMGIIDYKSLSQKYLSHDKIVSELRVFHFQMNDYQLLHIFYSMFIFNLITNIVCLVVLLLSILKDTHVLIKNSLRLICIGIMYCFVEIIMKRQELINIIIRFILLCLIKKWLSICILIKQSILLNPEYLNIRLYQRVNLT